MFVYPENQTKQPLFQKLFTDLKTAEMRYPEQHLLIEGQCKTLLVDLAYEIKNDADTSRRLLPIIFEEEATSNSNTEPLTR